MSKNVYLSRIIDTELKDKLEYAGAVLIEGAKWCGKTSTGVKASKSVIYMQDPDQTRSYLELAELKPSLLLNGETPRLIDEWQMAPLLWDAVRFEIDKRKEKGQFILTGSAVPDEDQKAHTGTGRISRITMRPMSLFESNESNGQISLNDLFNNKQNVTNSISSLTIEKLAFVLCRGGWPASIYLSEKNALAMAIDYVEAIINQDVSRVDGIEKNPERVRLLLRSLARNISTSASFKTIQEDIESTIVSVSEKTISTYLNALRRIFVVEDIIAWSPSLRSKTAIRTTPKRHFVDPSIATAVMRMQPEGLFKDMEYFGFLFEDLCARDLRIYAQAIDADVFHYRDKNELESDFIIRLRNGKWAAIEAKLGIQKIEEAAENLIKLRDKIDEEKMGKPAFLMILTGGEYAYCRKDGIWVVPIGCLKH